MSSRLSLLGCLALRRWLPPTAGGCHGTAACGHGMSWQTQLRNSSSALLQATQLSHDHPASSTWRHAFSEGGMLAAGLLAGSILLAASPSHAATPQAQAPPSSQGGPSSMPVSETAVHPLEYDPVTNEHTAKMTMARAAALEYYQAGRYPQAEAKFLEAVAEAHLGFDAKDPHIASNMNNLAEFYRNTGQHAKAEQLYKEALDLLESAYGERHWLYVSALHNLALSYEAAGDLNQAQRSMEKVMQLRLSMFGPRHFLYADSMFALGHILLKQAALLRDKAAGAAGSAGPGSRGQRDQAAGAAVAAGAKPDAGKGDGLTAKQGQGRRRWWWFGGVGRGGGGAEVLERKGLVLMDDAVRALEDAESVQTNVLLHWLADLGDLYKQRGRYTEALRCARKAMYHFTNDKGDVQANASELSDHLVELLLQLGQKKEARDVAADCAAARHQVFGREVVVAQAWLRLAMLEAQLDKGGDIASALQHAHNASVLSGELLGELNKASASNWLGRQGQDNGLKRARAALVHASALKFLADHSPSSQAAQSAQGLQTAVTTLEAAVTAAAQQLQRLSSQRSGEPPEDALAAVADLFVELQLLLLDCLEALAGRLAAAEAASGGGGGGGQLEAVRARQDELSRNLLGS